MNRVKTFIAFVAFTALALTFTTQAQEKISTPKVRTGREIQVVGKVSKVLKGAQKKIVKYFITDKQNKKYAVYFNKTCRGSKSKFAALEGKSVTVKGKGWFVKKKGYVTFSAINSIAENKPAKVKQGI